MVNDPFTILCIASYEKGADFMRQCYEEGCRVILLTSESLQNADWPRDCLDEIYYIPDVNKEWKMTDVIYSVSYLARTENIQRIVALDDFDVEKAASLREHLRVPGMGETTARYFRDKLAMRMRAREMGINVPEFVHILNYDKIREFLNKVGPPYILKPRMQAGAIGLKKINNAEELWRTIDMLGDKQSFYLLEQFITGEIFHIDSIIYKSEIKFALAHEYGLPPMEVAHDGRVFTSRTMKRGSKAEQQLLNMNEEVIKAMGLRFGVSHTEFICAKDDGKFYFLETSARVGGANIAGMIEASTGINFWREWAKIEILRGEGEYELPEYRNDYSAILQSLAKQEHPDLSSYNEPEVVWRLNKKYHAGLIVASNKRERILELVTNYTKRFYDEFFTTAPLKEKPSD
ncbi:MAG: ATP-grasp domain-containing protein [Melioribacteraceae bacterium]|nr:MAG: ATP-grasp domain-containing protein [Melioribacteraceae bacterium]